MPASGEIAYTARIRHPDVFERGRQNLASLELYRNGLLVAPTLLGSSFELVAPDGTDAIAAVALTAVTASVARQTLTAAQLPATLALGQQYQERWILLTPDGLRTFRRDACLCLFAWTCPVADPDLLARYPGLLTDFGSVQTSLQPQIDLASNWFVRKLWNHGKWPDLIVSPSDTFEPVLEMALAEAMWALYRVGGGAERYKVLAERHERGAVAAFAGMSYREDADHDGVADHDGRSSVGGVIHRNQAPRRTMARTGRW
jgi:hypothetical protein